VPVNASGIAFFDELGHWLLAFLYIIYEKIKELRKIYVFLGDNYIGINISTRKDASCCCRWKELIA
jgi:hypothetical protein